MESTGFNNRMNFQKLVIASSYRTAITIGFLIVMKKGLEVRLYPSKEQRVLIDRTLGCSRFVYNKVLGIKKRTMGRL